MLRPPILHGMSTVELLRHVKALPARDRQRFVLAVLRLEDPAPRSGRRPVGRVLWPDVEARARQIFGGAALPNLVLMEREESAR